MSSWQRRRAWAAQRQQRKGPQPRRAELWEKRQQRQCADSGRQDEASQVVHAGTWTRGSPWRLWREGCFGGIPSQKPREEL